jgi:hypothetical protein
LETVPRDTTGKNIERRTLPQPNRHPFGIKNTLSSVEPRAEMVDDKSRCSASLSHAPAHTAVQLADDALPAFLHRFPMAYREVSEEFLPKNAPTGA